MQIIPLFPLNTVFFPGMVLPLRIFERRYVDLVRDCLRQDKGFGVTLIKEGNEVGDAPEVYLQGTYAQIVDFDQTDDGLLQISVLGTQRFNISAHEQTATGLRQAKVSWVPKLASRLVPTRYRQLHKLFIRLTQDYYPQYQEIAESDQLNCEQLGFRLAECLPLDVMQKQMLLEIEQPDRRLDVLQGLLHDSLELF